MRDWRELFRAMSAGWSVGVCGVDSLRRTLTANGCQMDVDQVAGIPFIHTNCENFICTVAFFYVPLVNESPKVRLSMSVTPGYHTRNDLNKVSFHGLGPSSREAIHNTFAGWVEFLFKNFQQPALELCNQKSTWNPSNCGFRIIKRCFQYSSAITFRDRFHMLVRFPALDRCKFHIEKTRDEVSIKPFLLDILKFLFHRFSR